MCYVSKGPRSKRRRQRRKRRGGRRKSRLWVSSKRQRTSQDIVESFFCWPSVAGQTVGVLCFPRETALEKTKFSFSSDYLLDTASGLGIGAMSTSFISFIWCRHTQSLCILPQFLWVLMNFNLLDLKGFVSSVPFIPSDSNTPYVSSLARIPVTWGDIWWVHSNYGWVFTHLCCLAISLCPHLL